MMPSEGEDAAGEEAPPRLPPPIPELSEPLGAAGRLHPLTLLFRAVALMRAFIIPAIILLLVGKETTLGYLLLLFVLIPMLLAVIRYLTFTYRIDQAELIIRHGLIGRTERHIPLARVQDVRIEQGLLHRFFGVADVQVETAGSKGPEATLSVLARHEADHLRALVFQQGRSAASAAELGNVEAAGTLPTADETLRVVRVPELILAGITSNKFASILAVLVVAERLLGKLVPDTLREQWIRVATEHAEAWLRTDIEHRWVIFLAGAVLLLVLGVVLSAVSSVITFYGFTLSRRGEDLHRSYGLITHRSSSLPRRRIQVLKIEEKLLRRLFRLAALRADTAGGATTSQEHQRNEGRDVLLPVVRRGEVESLLPLFFPDWEAQEESWNLVSRRAIFRGTSKGVVFCLASSGLLWWRHPGVLSLLPLGLIVPIYLLNLMSYRHLGYDLGHRYFRTRRGWLGRATHIVPIRNAQVIVLRQSPLDRRHRVATLSVDTAGQAFTGGGPKVENVPVASALVLARRLAQQAAGTRYRW